MDITFAKACFSPFLCIFTQLRHWMVRDMEDNRGRSRSRSRSRDPDERLKRHILQCIPQEIDLDLHGLYHFCAFSGTSIPRLALFQTLQMLWNQGLKIQYRGGCHYENDPKCDKMSAAINKTNPLQSHHRQDISAFPRDMQGMQVMSKSKILTTIASPCTKISLGILNNSNLQSEVGPHAMPSSLFWTAQAGILALSKTVHMNQNVVVAEMVPAALAHWEEQFDSAIGPAVHMNAHEGADRKRTYRTSPHVEFPIQYVSTTAAPHHLLLDGCTWPAHEDIKASRPPTLRAIYPFLLDRQANHSISHTDKMTLRMFQIKTPDGKIRFAGPQHLAQWLELPQTIIANIQSAYPCERQPIDPIGKWTAKQWSEKSRSSDAMNPDLFQMCGDRVLCRNCSEAAELLGRAWNYSTAVSILTATIRQAFTRSDVSHFTAFQHMCPHFCNQPCPLSNTLEQAKGRTPHKQTSTQFLFQRPITLP